MSLRLPSWKTLAVAFAGLIVAWLLFAWLALPALIQSQAERFIAEKTGHRLSLDKPSFNPFELSLRLANLRLDEPDGKPLLAFRELLVDLSAASLTRRAFVFDAISIDGLEVSLVQRGDGRLNWSALLEALKSKDAPRDERLPRIDIAALALSNGRVNIADQRATPEYRSRIEPLNLQLSDVSTLPDEQGQYRLAARLGANTKLTMQAAATLNPLALGGNLTIENLDLAQFDAYLHSALPIVRPTGLASLSTNYRLALSGGHISLNLDQMAVKLSGVGAQGTMATNPALAIESIEASNGRFDLTRSVLDFDKVVLGGARLQLRADSANPPAPVTLGGLAIESVHVDLAAHDASVARVVLDHGSVALRRAADGSIDLLDAFAEFGRPVAKAEAKPAATTALAVPAQPWRYRLDKLDLASFTVRLRDESVQPSANFALGDIAVGLTGVSQDLAAALPLRASFAVHGGGHCDVDGMITPATPAANLQIKLSDLALKPAEPYLAAFAKVKLVGGKLSSDGRLVHGAHGTSYRGGFAVRDLRITEAADDTLLLGWKSLSTQSLAVTERALEIDELALDGLDTRLIIAKDKTINFTRLLRQPATANPASAEPVATAAPVATVAPLAPVAVKAKEPPAFVASVERLRISNGEMDFADLSLALPFSARIHDLKGNITGLSSRPDAPGQVELDGQVDEFGLARAAGQISLTDPTDYMDLRVVFRNVEMTRLTPYSTTFAGRKIASGKLSLDLAYKINKRQLRGENQVVMDQLVLGERVESPEAKNLPLDLAIAILQDSDGRIDLGLPISGSLDDPQFSYGQIVWKAIVNVLSKIVTAPFRALGALFGGSEKFENIAFEAGDAQLTGPEREKLVQLATALGKRPTLALTIHGVYAEADRVALQDMQLRRAILTRMGQRVDPQGDPGPVSTRQLKVQQALEALYGERVAAADLAALKEGFRRANPGQLEESGTGKLMSRLSGLFREKKTLSEDEVTQLKGADFHALLYQRLRVKEAVGDERLLALAKGRGESTSAALVAAGVATDRLTLLAPEKVEGDAQNIPLKLVLAPAKSGADQPVASPPQGVGQ